MAETRVLAFRLNGDGTKTLIDPEVPMTGVSVEPVLNAGSVIEGKIELPYLSQIADDGKPVIEAWSTALFVEIDGDIVGGGIVTEDSYDYNERTLSTLGFADYPAGMPFTSSWVSTALDQAKTTARSSDALIERLSVQYAAAAAKVATLQAQVPASPKRDRDAAQAKVQDAIKVRDKISAQISAEATKRDKASALLTAWENPQYPTFTDGAQGVDPADIFRYIWEHLQVQPKGNLGVIVERTPTPERIGKSIPATEYDDDNDGDTPEFENGEYRLAWYETTDLGEKTAELAENTPFDFWEEHSWNADRTDIVHRIRIAYPRAGARRTDVQLVIDENVGIPSVSNADVAEFATAILALGAGSGGTDINENASGRLHTVIQRDNDHRIRRCKLLDDPSRATLATLTTSARTELEKRDARYALSSLETVPGRDDDLQSLRLGDEVIVVGDVGWRSVRDWYKITGITYTPEEGTMSLEVELVR